MPFMWGHDNGKGDEEMKMTEGEFRQWLMNYDRDKDGRINVTELAEAIRAHGGRFSNWRARWRMNMVDTNHNGVIDYDEIGNLRDYARKYFGGEIEMTEGEFKQWLVNYDRDGDGRINATELAEAIRAHGGLFSNWRASRRMKMADTNHNGVIDYDEIGNLREYARKYFGIILIPK